MPRQGDVHDSLSDVSPNHTELLSLGPAGIENGRSLPADNSRWTSEDRIRLCVLVGSAVSSLPLWGFSLSYGVFQEYYRENWTCSGPKEITGIIGTTQTGVMYLSMPFLFAIFTRRWACYRQRAALCGAALACLSFLLSSFSRDVSHLVVTQGIFAAFGCTLAFSPITLSLGEWFNLQNRLCNRAIVYGICLSCRSIVGATCPFLFRGLLDRYGFETTMRIWCAVVGALAVISVLIIPTPPMAISSSRPRKISWSFLRHPTIYIYLTATLLQSMGYGIPQTYLATFARQSASVSTTYSTLLITLINIPGIASSAFFGFLCDDRHFRLSTTAVTSLSALASALATFLFWGLAGARDSVALLTLFAVTFGFFASGYSACWGGVMKEMEREAAERNEALDSGLIYGLLNGARGAGYVGGGLLSVPLIGAGATKMAGGAFAYGTEYGPLIVFMGISLALGGWDVAWKWSKPLQGLSR